MTVRGALLLVLLLGALPAEAVPGFGNFELTSSVEILSRGATPVATPFGVGISFTPEGWRGGGDFTTIVSLTHTDGGAFLAGAHFDVWQEQAWSLRLRASGGPQVIARDDTAHFTPAVDGTVALCGTWGLVFGSVALGYAYLNDLWFEHTSVAVGLAW
jgi:hypothetical protein